MTTLEELYTLRHVKRWNGVAVTGTDTTAQHSYFVACISGLLVDLYNETSVMPLNKERVLIQALYHDVAEIYLTHITYGAKQQSDTLRAEVSVLKKKLFSEWCKKINCGDLTEDGQNSTTISEIIEFADIVDAWLYCKEEVDRGNMSMQEIYKRQRKALIRSIEKHEWAQRFCLIYLLDML